MIELYCLFVLLNSATVCETKAPLYHVEYWELADANSLCDQHRGVSYYEVARYESGWITCRDKTTFKMEWKGD